MKVKQMAITGLLVGAARGLIPRTTFGTQKPLARGLARRRAARKQQQAQRMPSTPPEKVDGHARRLSQLQGHTCLVLNADWQPLSYLPRGPRVRNLYTRTNHAVDAPQAQRLVVAGRRQGRLAGARPRRELLRRARAVGVGVVRHTFSGGPPQLREARRREGTQV